jgi:hypothetical protein
MDIDIPDVKAEVEAAFAEYETALTTNDVATLDRLFLDSARTIRYGAAENLYGYAEIAAFRAARPSAGLERSLERTAITTYGRDMATAWTHCSAAPRCRARSDGRARSGCARPPAGGSSRPM